MITKVKVQGLQFKYKKIGQNEEVVFIYNECVITITSTEGDPFAAVRRVVMPILPTCEMAKVG